ncbi:MAG TPA: acetyltransferase [Thermoanaerobaculia bacterium]|nr:acetyltransferase [Thermoanaerobaculia bacterium]
MKKLVIVGDGEFAEIACEYFTHDSDRQVAGFAVERAYRKKDELLGLPVVALEEVEQTFAPDAHDAFVAVAYGQLNRLRMRLCAEMKARTYALATYVSSHAFVWRDVQIGENCFIFEANVLQYSVRIGNNVVLWSGNHIGHQSVIEDNVFVASHAVISGYCTIGANSFIGVNASFRDHITVGRDAVVGAGAVVVKDVAERQVVRGNPAKPAGQDSFTAFGVRESG